MLKYKIIGRIHCKECRRPFTIAEDREGFRYLFYRGKRVSHCPCGHYFSFWASPKLQKRLKQEAEGYLRRMWEQEWEGLMDSASP